MIQFEDTRLLIKEILQRPFYQKWTIQGLGMLRTYLRPETRLHVWMPGARVPNVSDIHTHPWDFESVVLSGFIQDSVYSEGDEGVPYKRQQLLCGQGGGIKATPQNQPVSVYLKHMLSGQTYAAGQSYIHHCADIHASQPSPGCVTLVHRFRFHPDADHALVYWLEPHEWVSAEPRKAESWEVRQACELALSEWTPAADVIRQR